MEKPLESSQPATPWTDGAPLAPLPSLETDLTADACVIGAGVAGLSVAYQLARRGRSVVVLDDGARIASGETGHTTAHLSDAIDDGLLAIEQAHGADAARTCAQSHRAAIDEIERTVRDERIDCDFVRLDGYLFLGEGDDIGLLGMELAANQRAGLTDVRLVDRVGGLLFDPGPSLLFPRQAQLHPLKYAAGLARAATALGVRIFGNAHAESVEDGAPARVQVHGGFVVTASNVIVATGTPINDRVTIHTKQAAWRTYVIAATIPRRTGPPSLFWDTSRPYHYVRTQPGSPGDGGDIVLVGGEDHRTGHGGETEQPWERLTAWARRRFPMMRDVKFRWSGQVMEPADGVAFIGRNPGDEHVFIVTGDSGQGMTHGTIAGLLLADLVTGVANAWSSLYDPGRLPLRSLAEYATDNLEAVAAYRGWFTPGDVEDVSAIRAGEGAVVRRGMVKVACYRDEAGCLHERSATCPHLGAIVTWNAAEKTWDCPAHGSRFDALGRVTNGPANQDLGASDAEPAEKKASAAAGAGD